MNFQPPDPPEYGHCLTCKTSIHQDEVRGDHCIECEPEAMTTNQTIDRVPRELLERCARELSIGIGPAPKNRANELRALLDAPAVEVRDKCGVQMVDCPECSHQWDHFFECGNGPANPKPTGLSQGWNLTRKHDGFVVGHQSVAYPPDEKAIERAERDGYVWVPFLVPAAQPQDVPVEWGAPKTVRQLISQLETLDQDLRPLSMLRVPASVFEDGKERVRATHLSFSHERVNGQWLAPFKSDGEKVLAFWCRMEQPAPVAVVMSFDFEHPSSKERRTVALSKQDVFDGMEDYFYDKIGEQICRCESVGETNVVDCSCDEYVHDFEIVKASLTR